MSVAKSLGIHSGGAMASGGLSRSLVSVAKPLAPGVWLKSVELASLKR